MIQRGKPTKQPLFCIHAIWGNVLFYRNLAQYLLPDQPFYALQAQGLDGKAIATYLHTRNGIQLHQRNTKNSTSRTLFSRGAFPWGVK